jgi:peptidoglycan/LPS O-acetylase OafA/YrhL
VLIALAYVATRRLGWSFRFPPVLVIGAVSLTSLAWSVWFTGEDAAQAYFVTTTRVWELGVGATLAAAVAAGLRVRGARRALGSRMGGLAAILWSALSYTGATHSPASRL